MAVGSIVLLAGNGLSDLRLLLKQPPITLEAGTAHQQTEGELVNFAGSGSTRAAAPSDRRLQSGQTDTSHIDTLFQTVTTYDSLDDSVRTHAQRWLVEKNPDGSGAILEFEFPSEPYSVMNESIRNELLKAHQQSIRDIYDVISYGSGCPKESLLPEIDLQFNQKLNANGFGQQALAYNFDRGIRTSTDFDMSIDWFEKMILPLTPVNGSFREMMELNREFFESAGQSAEQIADLQARFDAGGPWSDIMDDCDCFDRDPEGVDPDKSCLPMPQPTPIGGGNPPTDGNPPGGGVTTPSIFRPRTCKSDSPPGWKSYTVKKGDTLNAIAITTGTSVARLKEVNCLVGDILIIGLPIFVPSP